MNHVYSNLCGSERAVLDSAILLYRGVGGITAATLNDVRIEKGKPQIQSGRALHLDVLRDITSAMIAGQKKDRSPFIPRGLIAQAPGMICFQLVSLVRNIYFRVPDWNKTEVIKREIVWPRLLFLVKNGRLSVFYYNYFAEYPDANTELYYAPFPNIFASGEVCMPSIPESIGCQIDDIPKWIDLFCDSPFAHANHDTVKGGVMIFWKNFLDSNSAIPEFTKGSLIPFGKTLGEVIA